MSNEPRSFQPVELNDFRKGQIAHQMAEVLIREKFKIMPHGEFRRLLGSLAEQMGAGITVDELASFVHGKLANHLAKMYGRKGCGITFYP